MEHDLPYFTVYWLKEILLMRRLIIFVPVLLLLAMVLILANHEHSTLHAAPAPAAPPPANTAAPLWRTVAETDFVVRGTRLITPAVYRTTALDEPALSTVLAQAPLENTVTHGAGVLLSLPLPDGTLARFRVVEAPIMAPALTAQFPQIRTYLGQGIDDPTATLRFDRTPAGFHALILGASGSIFIDPYSRNDTTHYISYFAKDYTLPPGSHFAELGMVQTQPLTPHLPHPAVAAGPTLRTYRLALAADGEYTQFSGGTVPAALAAMVTTMNRVDGVYERELAIRLVLIANETAIIYTNPTTDPYTNDNGETMLTENQNNLDTVIGNANYDIGHVFSTGGGGIAGLGVICSTQFKGQGVTGKTDPVGDPFDIDYVAHEMGHQSGANHPFNATTGSCGGNRSDTTAYEPGSGSTIMSYAGICGAEDLQRHSDPYFHTISFDQIMDYTTNGTGATCAATSATGNHAPVPNAGASYTIPQQTAFRLTGSATDADGDALTYGWEQFNLGAAAPPDTDDGSRPIFRSFNPTTSPIHLFPQLTSILSSTTILGESLPTTNRTLTFRLTVRDNRAGGGGVDHATVNIPVTTSAGPFRVTAPNTAVTWPAASSQTVTWNVANTTAAPVSCPAVNIVLSYDGGYSFPATLAAGAPNNGTAQITVPNIDTAQARVQVACANNIFFDISRSDFTISGGVTATATTTPAAGTATATPLAGTATVTPPAGTATATSCAIRFTDVTDTSAYYYQGVYYLACRGVISGYSDGTFKPFNNTTRAQMTKIVTLAFNIALVTPPATGTFADVDPSSVFYQLVETAAARGIVSGYSCGGVNPQTGADEPCDTGSRPYFRPNNAVTRGQLAKIVVIGAGWALRTPATPNFSDVPTSSVFYSFIETAVCHGAVGGYSDSTFRPNNYAFRGQIAKIVYLAVTNPPGICAP